MIQCPALAKHLRSKYEKENAATITGPEIIIDYAASRIESDGQTFGFPALSPTAQRLVVTGGAENVAKAQLAET